MSKDYAVEVCIYCEQEVKETDEKYCCMWVEYFSHTGSEDFTSKNFKQMVAGSYKAKNKMKKTKRKDVKYDLDAYILHTDGITLK